MFGTQLQHLIVVSIKIAKLAKGSLGLVQIVHLRYYTCDLCLAIFNL